MRLTARRRLAIFLPSVLCFAGCAASPITASRIQASVETTFANLADLQTVRLGSRPAAAPDFAVTAICRRTSGRGDAGSGEWSCTLVWQASDRRTIRDSYDLFVTTAGCYTATAAGERRVEPVLRTADGRPMKNLLYAFEGCFDPT